MKKNLYTTLSFLLLPLLLFSAEYRAVKDGDWADPNAWNQGSVPGATDDIIIEGYSIYITDAIGNITVNSLTLKNASGRKAARLSIDGDVVFTINNDLIVTAEDVNKDVEVQLFNRAILKVKGDANFIRSLDNNQRNILELNIHDGSIMEVTNNFLFNYQNGKSQENGEEIFLNNKAQLLVGGTLQLYLKDGKDFNLELFDISTVTVGGDLDVQLLGGYKFNLGVDATSNIGIEGNADFVLDGALDFINLNVQGGYNVGGDLKLESATGGKRVNLIASGAASNIDIDGDVSMSASDEGDVSFALQGEAQLNLAGDFLRPTNYGSFDMDGTSMLVLDGEGAQTIPQNTMTGGGTDAFKITNISFNNSSGMPMVLAGPLVIEDEMELSEGVIKIADGGSLTVADNAVISGGSPTAYVDGPITKVGSTNGENFVFPTGDGDVYAPLEFSPLLDQNGEYTIQYRDDPPPIEEKIKSPTNNLNDRGYWSINRKPGSSIPSSVTLGWTDAEERGIDDLTNAVVVFIDTTAGSQTPEWTSLGRSTLLGSLITSITGLITNSLDDPPPIEDEGLMTIGFTGGILSGGISTILGDGGLGARGAFLPVELTSFTATRYNNNMVSLEWETETEINSHYFEVERSADGQHFETIGTMPAKVNSNTISRYAMTDVQPYRGQNYYRLKMIDLDGSYEFSDVAAVFIDNFGEIMLYPNPVIDYIQVVGGEELDESTYVEIIDQLGRRIFSGYLPIENRRLFLSTNNLNIREGGTYYLKLNFSSGRSQSFKFIKAY